MFSSFLFFETMITPKLITLVYWILLAVVIVSGIGTWFGGYEGFTFVKFLTGIGIMVGGGLAARIWCELLIVLFKINENIQKIAEK